MPRYFIRLSFDGRNYAGWQIQSHADTVQARVNDALSKILHDNINVVGCGRTDTGVHSRIFYAHFDLKDDHAPGVTSSIVKSLNGYLPHDIAVRDVFPVKHDLHARFSAVSRTYEYHVSRAKDPFRKDYSWYVFGDLDLTLMNEAADLIRKTEDFSSFTKSNSDVKTFRCRISRSEWKPCGNLLVYTITADRFLRNMVRAIVGTLIDVGRRKTSLDELLSIIESRNRSNAGYSVPARGLFLTGVSYPEGALPALKE
jgi:tRNA pseudouridine38-40 synthase